MTDKLREKLKTLPQEPGVYFHRDHKGKIIYIGKAGLLKNRVSTYFQNGRKDPKTTLLVADIADTEWITTGSEAEALFLESEFIKRYRPKYNIDWKDEKNFIYVKISADEFPVLSYVRRPLDDKAQYFGPYTSSDALRRAMRMLRKVFPYVTHANWPKRGCLQYHLGLCPGPEEGAITPVAYRRNLKRLTMYLSGQQTKLQETLERDMQRAAAQRNFEAAALYRDQLFNLKAFAKQMVFSDKEAFDVSRDQALTGLADRLNLASVPRRIEAYDISHIGGQDNVASMVVFTDGMPNRDEYRRFKMRAGGNNDVLHMREVISRRFGPKHLAEWPKPDLLVIDGGQPQLTAALDAMAQANITIPAIGLAKREEEIITIHSESSAVPGATAGDGASITARGQFDSILLPGSSHVLMLLQRIRDEAHRFAINYQSQLHAKKVATSQLDDVPGIGPVTRKLLIRRFGSVRGVRLASLGDLSEAVGPSKAALLREHLAAAKTREPSEPAS